MSKLEKLLIFFIIILLTYLWALLCLDRLVVHGIVKDIDFWLVFWYTAMGFVPITILMVLIVVLEVKKMKEEQYYE